MTEYIGDPNKGMKDNLNDWIFALAQGKVLTGPFVGMTILQKEAWHDGNLGTMILGCYEEELHKEIEGEIVRLNKMSRPVISVVGCAEGYYAVGMARRVPRAQVIAMDILEEALVIARENAELNEVCLQLDNTVEAALAAPDFVLMDCEHAESEYLDPEKYPALLKANILVECHDYEIQDEITSSLVERFHPTHTIGYIREAGRDPNEFPFLRPLHSDCRWIAVSEGRPCMMHWLFMSPRNRDGE